MNKSKSYRTLAIAALIFLVFSSSAEPVSTKTEDLLGALIKVADWLVANQNSDGTFNLKMNHLDPEYQDAFILGCAAIILLDTYQITGNARYLEAANLTLTLLSNWQDTDGDWSSHSRYISGGVYYPVVAFAKYQLYTNNNTFMDNIQKAAESLIRLKEKISPQSYVFEIGEGAYTLLLTWKVTNSSEYKEAADRLVSQLESKYFDYKAGAWNTRVDGKGPQGMWDAVLPALPLLVHEYPKLRRLANRSFYWAFRNLRSFEAGAYITCSPKGEVSLSDDIYRDTESVYSHFTAEFLVLASILGKEAGETANWLISMQAPDGGFYFRKSPDGSIDRREFVWDSFWAFFGLYTYLQRKLSRELESMISELSSEIRDAEKKGANVSLPKNLLEIANRKLSSEELFSALSYIQKANKTLQASLEAFERINEVQALIVSIEGCGVNVTEAKHELSLALEAYSVGDFENSTKFAAEAEKLANLSIVRTKSEVERILKEVESFLEDAISAGANITKAEVLLKDAKRAYSEGNYTKALELAESANESALEAISSAKSRKKEIFIGAIAATAVLSISVTAIIIWRRHTSKVYEREMKDFMEKYENILDKIIVLPPPLVKKEIVREEIKARIQHNKMGLFIIGSAIAALAVSELLFAIGNATFGILVALGSVTILYPSISISRVGSAVGQVVDIICLLLMYILFISAMPWFFFRQPLLLPAVYLVLIALCVWYIRDSDLHIKEVGLRMDSPSNIVISGFLGVISGFIEFLILLPPPAIPSFSLSYFLKTLFYMTFFVGLGEELLFRGLLLTSLERIFDPYPALLIDSLIFAILHFTWRSVPEIIFVFLAGLLLGFIFQKTRSLSAPIVLHAINNTFLIAVFPFL